MFVYVSPYRAKKAALAARNAKLHDEDSMGEEASNNDTDDDDDVPLSKSMSNYAKKPFRLVAWWRSVKTYTASGFIAFI